MKLSKNQALVERVHRLLARYVSPHSVTVARLRRGGRICVNRERCSPLVVVGLGTEGWTAIEGIGSNYGPGGQIDGRYNIYATTYAYCLKDLGLLTAREVEAFAEWFKQASRQYDKEQKKTQLDRLAEELGYRLVRR